LDLAMTIKTSGVSAAPSAELVTSVDRRPLPSRVLLLLVAIVLGGLGNLANALFGLQNGNITIDWAAKHQSAWAAATYGTALTGLSLVALLAAVCVLVRGRGARWATVSLAIGSVGTFLWMVGAPILAAYLPMGTQNVISSAQANALVDYFEKHDMTQAGVAFPAFLLLLVTQITVTVALIRSRAVPLWVPIVFFAGGVVETVFAGGGPLTAVLTVPQILAEIAIGWYAYQKSKA
jgi:hypothetical protein